MKRFIFSILSVSAIAVVAALSGCGKAKSLANIGFDVPYKQQFSVPSTGYAYGVPLPGGGIDLPFPAIPVPTNAQTYTAQYGTATNKVVSVSMKSLSLEIQSPAGENFDFLDNVKVYVSAKSQPEVMVASRTSIPKGQSTLSFDIPASTVNLKNYFLADTLYFRMDAHINAVPPTGEQMQLSSVFHVIANPLQ